MKTKFAIVSCALALASCVSASSQLDWAYAKPTLFDFEQSIKLGGDCFKIRGIARARNGDHLGAMIDQYGATIFRFSSQLRNFLNDLLSLKALP